MELFLGSYELPALLLDALAWDLEHMTGVMHYINHCPESLKPKIDLDMRDTQSAVASIGRCLHAALFTDAIKQRFMHYYMQRHDLHDLRTLFAKHSVPYAKSPVNHPHPEAAALRNTAVNFCSSFAYMSGRTPYYVQMSRADQRRGERGSRAWFWASDLDAEQRYDKLTGDDLKILIDVDYYLDTKALNSGPATPVLLYTLVPEDAACAGSANLSFTFDAHSTLQCQVAGGDVYSHSLWNWATNSVRVTSGHLLTRRSIHYSVAHHRIGPHKYVVLLVPRADTKGLGSYLCDYWLQSPVLTRLSPVQGEFARLNINHAGKQKVSVARLGDYTAATVDRTCFDSISSVARHTKHDLMRNSVASHLPDKTPDHVICILHDYMIAKHKAGALQWSLVANPPTVVYEPFTPAFDQDGFKPAMVTFMAPICPEAYLPARGLANEVVMVRERITKMQEQAAARHTPFHSKDVFALNWLIERAFAAHKHRLIPCSTDEVLDKQNRPNQRRNIYDANDLAHADTKREQCFMKAEAYAKYADPRNITTIQPFNKLHYSTIIYPVADVFKQMSWYAFGKTPRCIAYTVAAKLSSAEHCTLTDITRMDGSTGINVRLVENMLLRYLYPDRLHADVLAAHASQQNLRCRTTHGVTYESGTSRASGSPETSVFNTFANLCYSFLAIYRTTGELERSYNSLGLYGGDDGFNPLDLSQHAVKCAALFGFEAKVDVIPRGRCEIKFLARQYGPDVWYGNPDSMCDVRRQLRKFHVCTPMPGNVSNATKYLEKLRSYMYTDLNTPVFRDLLKMEANLGNCRFDVFRVVGSYNAVTYSSDEQYPNDDNPWKLEHFLSENPDFNYARWVSFAESGVLPSACLDLFPCCSENTLAVPNGAVTNMDHPVRHKTEVPKAAAENAPRKLKQLFRADPKSLTAAEKIVMAKVKREKPGPGRKPRK